MGISGIVRHADVAITPDDRNTDRSSGPQNDDFVLFHELTCTMLNTEIQSLLRADWAFSLAELFSENSLERKIRANISDCSTSDKLLLQGTAPAHLNTIYLARPLKQEKSVLISGKLSETVPE